MHGTEVVPTDFKLAPELLANAGYVTHAIGKWNLGHHLKPYTPTWRGFQTFFGYYVSSVFVWDAHEIFVVHVEDCQGRMYLAIWQR